MLPLNELVVPSTADVPTLQNTLQASPPPAMVTADPGPVVIPLPTLKTQEAFESPPASSVNSADNPAVVSKQ
jgi:hypothetical protein